MLLMQLLHNAVIIAAIIVANAAIKAIDKVSCSFINCNHLLGSSSDILKANVIEKLSFNILSDTC